MSPGVDISYLMCEADWRKYLIAFQPMYNYFDQISHCLRICVLGCFLEEPQWKAAYRFQIEGLPSYLCMLHQSRKKQRGIHDAPDAGWQE